MRKVTAWVELATSVRIANVWLLRDGERTFLVDTSHPVERLGLRASLWRAGVRRRGDLDGVLLTHRHSDHAVNASWLRETFDAPVFCHRFPARCRGRRRLEARPARDRRARPLRRYLREMPPTETLCSGHGPAVRDDVERKLGRLLEARRDAT
jgi:glyoxylase-like metal-dependent hydrolase (beta-lactamase superfamily II)